MIDQSISGLTNGLSSSTKSLAKSTTSYLLENGSTRSSIESITGSVVNTVVSGAAEEFYSLAGKVTNRLGGSSISDLRGTVNLIDYLLDINPTSKISSKKSKDSYEVFAII